MAGFSCNREVLAGHFSGIFAKGRCTSILEYSVDTPNIIEDKTHIDYMSTFCDARYPHLDGLSRSPRETNEANAAYPANETPRLSEACTDPMASPLVGHGPFNGRATGRPHRGASFCA
jgi:hypothetical protein